MLSNKEISEKLTDEQIQQNYIDEQGDKLPSLDEALKILDKANQQQKQHMFYNV